MKPSNIIGIGASAGGLDALKNFFTHVPDNTGLAFVVIQHLSPDYKSMMPSLLGKVTDLPIEKATDGMVLEENHIYLIPASNNIELEEGVLKYINRAPSNKLNLSIDIFFNSLAKEQKEKAIGIILSGTGSDGSRGGKSIKENGGTIFVQDPTNLQFSGMPNNAIITGIADYVLPVEQIPEELISYLEFNYSQLKAFESKHAHYYDKIVELIYEQVGIDYRLYRPQTLNRRLIRRIDFKGTKNLKDYYELIIDDEAEVHELAHEFLIGVTEFFRDEEYLNALNEKVIPKLFTDSDADQIKLWSIACSTGEEVYSIAILLQEYIEKNKLTNLRHYKIFATDINKYALDIASKGVYSKVAVKDIPKRYLDKYFTENGDNYTILPSIRQRVIFSYHNILSNPPFSKMDLVVCRNVLIYLKAEAQQKVFKNITYALNNGGFLFLGGSEHIGRFESYYEAIDKRARIYKKTNTEAEFTSGWLPHDTWKLEKKKRLTESNIDVITDESIRSLTEITNSLCIIVNHNLDIVRLYGDFNKFASFPKTGFDLQNLKLINLLPPEFSIPIASSISKILPTSTAAITKTFSFDYDKELHFAKLSIKNLSSKRIRQRLFLINIVELDGAVPSKGDKKSTSKASAIRKEEYLYLQQTLTDTRENLQMTIEELEASNEEAQATNEELVSSNEELQSTNEELQSVNEELNTVNTELEERNVELIELNDDFANLIRSSGAINVFVAEDLTIKNFTNEENAVFSFIKTDIGRNIKDLSLPDPDLIRDIKEVLKDLQVRHKEVLTQSGKWFIQAIHPYRNTDGVISGVVLNYSEVTELKKRNEFIQNVLQTVPGVIYIFDLVEKINLFVNETSQDLLGKSKEEVKDLDNDLLDVVIHPDDLPAVIEHQDKIINSKTDEVKSIIYRVLDDPKNVDGSSKYLISYELPIERDANGKATKTCGIGIDIDTFHRAQLALDKQMKIMDKIQEFSPSFVFIYNYDQKQVVQNCPKLVKLLGLKKTKSQIFSHQLFEPYLNKVDYNILEISVNDILKGNNEEASHEFKITNQKGEVLFFHFRLAVFHKGENKRIQSIIFYITDITKISTLKENQQLLENANKDLEEFAYISSHDLKQPLRTIKASVEILKGEIKNEKNEQRITEVMQMIDTTVNNMSQSLNTILDYSKMNNKKHLEKVLINDAVEHVLQDLKTQIEKTKAKITVSAKDELFADPALLRLLIQNLVSNALKFVKNGEVPKIQIRSKKTKEAVILSIKDNGIGITEKNLKRIFLLFQKLNSSEQYEGSGIGLAHVKKIMKLHQGTIDVFSESGKGSEFVCTFPNIK